MTKAVIFDWFGTLAHWEHASASNYTAVLAKFGYEPHPLLIDAYHTRWDGIDHREHSRDRESYVAWTRTRLRTLASDCGVGEEMADRVVDALLESDYGAPMVLFSDTLPVLEALKRRGITVAICSNWGWDLETFLDATGVSAFVDTAVTSARAGFRKPHPGIYDLVLEMLDIDASESLFVGDSWHPDVVGPRARGISSVHICRGPSEGAPDLPEGTYRISSLGELLTLSPLTIAGEA